MLAARADVNWIHAPLSTIVVLPVFVNMLIHTLIVSAIHERVPNQTQDCCPSEDFLQTVHGTQINDFLHLSVSSSAMAILRAYF